MTSRGEDVSSGIRVIGSPERTVQVIGTLEDVFQRQTAGSETHDWYLRIDVASHVVEIWLGDATTPHAVTDLLTLSTINHPMMRPSDSSIIIPTKAIVLWAKANKGAPLTVNFYTPLYEPAQARSPVTRNARRVNASPTWKECSTYPSLSKRSLPRHLPNTTIAVPFQIL